jgi:hypothetical protein
MKSPVHSASENRKSGPARRFAAGLAMVLAVVALPPLATAQDANYWALPYGPIGQLLGGVLIGGARDLSATYYNPGGLILTDDPTFLLSMDVLEREKLQIEGTGGAAASASDLSSTRTAAAPSLIAGALPLGGAGSRFAWSYLPRFSSDFLTNERRNYEGNEGLANEVVISERTSESWFGGSWSRLSGEHLGLGLTGYLAYRSHEYRSEFNAQQDTTGSGATVLIVDNARFHNYRLLAKLGAALDRGPFQLGLTVTTPSLGLLGKGDIGFTRSLTGVDLDGDQVPDNYLTRGFEDDVDADYRSSWAVGAGGVWRHAKTRLHVSAEWFNGVEDEILTSEPLSPGPGLDDIVLELDQTLDDVIAFGVGVEHELSAQTSLYGAFTSDPSALADSHDPRSAVAIWDLYHLTVGVATKMMGSRITGGLGYSWGSSEQEDLFSDVGNPQALDPAGFELSYRRFTFLVGFELGSKATSPAE